MKEEDIIARLRDGDSQAMEALMQQYGPFLRYILTPILPNASEREECFSEVIVRIWQKQAQYDPEKGSWKAWIAAIARNAALNWNRNRKQTESLSEEIPTDTMIPEDILLRKEGRKYWNRRYCKYPVRNVCFFTESITICNPQHRLPENLA